MKIHQFLWRSGQSWSNLDFDWQPSFVLTFGSREALSDRSAIHSIVDRFKHSDLLLCSTAGEILDTEVYDDTIVLTLVHLEKTQHRVARCKLSEPSESRASGTRLALELTSPDLRHVFVLSDGQIVNGSDLVQGLTEALPDGVSVTGGLAGDAARFERTLVGWNEQPDSGNIIALGLYGDHIQVGYGSRGGWDSFGPERNVTRSVGNVLYELDGKNALDLYKEYLGEKAKELPGSALLFPLSIKTNGDEPVVRTILSVDESRKSMTFAGDIPQGARARLMKANFDRLVDGAYHAAESSVKPLVSQEPDLAILISCVGRKLVLGERIDEEVETIREVIGHKASICGFYSYGEISPFAPFAKCELHNQTMTITTLKEV